MSSRWTYSDGEDRADELLSLCAKARFHAAPCQAALPCVTPSDDELRTFDGLASNPSPSAREPPSLPTVTLATRLVGYKPLPTGEVIRRQSGGGKSPKALSIVIPATAIEHHHLPHQHSPSTSDTPSTVINCSISEAVVLSAASSVSSRSRSNSAFQNEHYRSQGLFPSGPSSESSSSYNEVPSPGPPLTPRDDPNFHFHPPPHSHLQKVAVVGSISPSIISTGLAMISPGSSPFVFPSPSLPPELQLRDNNYHNTPYQSQPHQHHHMPPVHQSSRSRPSSSRSAVSSVSSAAVETTLQIEKTPVWPSFSLPIGSAASQARLPSVSSDADCPALELEINTASSQHSYSSETVAFSLASAPVIYAVRRGATAPGGPRKRSRTVSSSGQRDAHVPLKRPRTGTAPLTITPSTSSNPLLGPLGLSFVYQKLLAEQAAYISSRPVPSRPPRPI